MCTAAATRSRAIATLVMAASACTACSEAGADPPHAVVRDSAGITIVENEIPDSAGAVWWALAMPPLTEIGGVDANEAEAVFRVTGAARLSDGRIVVANGGTSDVRYYRPEGTHEVTSGRQGGGPGEFQRLSGLIGLPGDSVLVIDGGARRSSVLDPAGDFVREIVLTEPGGAPSPSVPSGRFGNGSLLATRSDATSLNEMPSGGVQRLGIVFTAVSPDGGAVDTLATVAGTERAISIQGSQGSIRSISILTPPFAKEVSYAASDSLLYVAAKDAPEVHVYDLDGRLIRIVRTGTALKPVTEARLEALLSRSLVDVEPDRLQERRDALVAVARDVVPPYGAIEVDAAGNLWVEDYDDALAPAGVRSVFDPDGRLIARIQLPAGMRVHDIGEDYVVGVERDDLDVERVRVYRILKASDP